MRTVWKALLKFAVVIDGVIIVAFQQIHISGGKEEPAPATDCLTELAQFVERALKTLLRRLWNARSRLAGRDAELQCRHGLNSHGCENLAGIVTAVAFLAIRERQLQYRTGSLD